VDASQPLRPAGAALSGGPPLQPPTGLRRWPYLLLAWVCLALGVIGIVVPGLPTTPFILLAGWAAARGSTRLHAWLHGHYLFGPMLRDWEREGAVSRRAKWTASVAILLCAGLMFWVAEAAWAAAIGTGVMAVVAVWLWRRPEPRWTRGAGPA